MEYPLSCNPHDGPKLHPSLYFLLHIGQKAFLNYWS